MQISVCFCKTCISLKNLENIQISVNMINRLDITDEYSVKCDFILNTVTFIDAALNISLRKLWKCNVLWFYLFGQGVPNETKGTINLKYLNAFVPFKWNRLQIKQRKCIVTLNRFILWWKTWYLQTFLAWDKNKNHRLLPHTLLENRGLSKCGLIVLQTENGNPNL